MPSHDPSRIEVLVVSDVVCPWCFIGKRQLDLAIERWMQQPEHAGEAPPVVRWLPFELDPSVPAGGMPRIDYMTRKFGAERLGAIHERVAAAGRSVGLEMQFDRIVRQPNTRKAHALIDQAAEADLQPAVAQALFTAFFIEGKDLSDDATLRAIGAACGMNDELLEGALRNDEVLQRVGQAEDEIRERGVSGVPLYVIGRDGAQPVVVHGAQGADVLLRALAGEAPA